MASSVRDARVRSYSRLSEIKLSIREKTRVLLFSMLGQIL